MMYTIYGTPKAQGFRILWMLEELGQPYELVPCGPHSEEIKFIFPAASQHQLFAVDSRTFKQTGAVDVHSQPVFAVARPDGRQIWVNFAHLHNDTIQVVDDPGAEGWTTDPWGGKIRDGKLHGRGACDMKCRTSASIWTYALLHRIKDMLKGKLTLSLRLRRGSVKPLQSGPRESRTSCGPPGHLTFCFVAPDPGGDLVEKLVQIDAEFALESAFPDHQ